MEGNRRDYVKLLNTFRYRVDIRNADPSPSHLRAFRLGWKHGAERRGYGDTALDRLSWQNLGNRLGLELGHVGAEEQERAFEILARHLQQTRRLDER